VQPDVLRAIATYRYSEEQAIHADGRGDLYWIQDKFLGELPVTICK
jgi:hypothetical protein